MDLLQIIWIIKTKIVGRFLLQIFLPMRQKKVFHIKN